MENPQGQLELNTLRGQWIKNFLQQNNFKNIVEIGTWKGLGSTLCILEGKSDTSEFISLECDLVLHENAKTNLERYKDKVKLIYGTICTEDEIEGFSSTLSLDSQKTEWLNLDLANVRDCPYVLDLIPHRIDFLLLDGGEFSTYTEWQKLKDRTKIVAMDDISQIKTSKIFNELLSDFSYKILTRIDEGNGFAAFERIDFKN